MDGLSDLFRDLMQVAYVTDDIVAATEHLQSTMGIHPFHINRGASLGGEIEVAGETAADWVIDAALSYAGSTNIEVIQPIRGSVDLYTSGIRPGSPLTFHHVGYRVDDFDHACDVVARSGRSWIQHATFGDIRFGYLDLTDELGHYAEIMELGPQASAYFDSIKTQANS